MRSFDVDQDRVLVYEFFEDFSCHFALVDGRDLSHEFRILLLEFFGRVRLVNILQDLSFQVSGEIEVEHRSVCLVELLV